MHETMSKSIRLSEAAYDRLAAHKREDETFSEVVLRLAGERSLTELAGVPASVASGKSTSQSGGRAQRRTVDGLVGILDDEQTEDVRAAIEERRERRSDDLESVVDDLRAGDCS